MAKAIKNGKVWTVMLEDGSCICFDERFTGRINKRIAIESARHAAKSEVL